MDSFSILDEYYKLIRCKILSLKPLINLEKLNQSINILSSYIEKILIKTNTKFSKKFLKNKKGVIHYIYERKSV